jgi:hypothetical protein
MIERPVEADSEKAIDDQRRFARQRLGQFGDTDYGITDVEQSDIPVLQVWLHCPNVIAVVSFARE